MRVSAAILVVLLLASCRPARLPMRRICQDGWPIKILQHPECPRGICGYTCAPDRWRMTTPSMLPLVPLFEYEEPLGDRL
jgi:hypothetical protein